MRQSSRTAAICGLTAALSLVLMALGSAMGVMTYVCPILVGVLLLCVREELGVRMALTEWAAIGLLAVILVPEPEMNAVFVGVFGWYPAAKPALDRIPRPFSLPARLLSMNAGAVLSYTVLAAAVGLQDMPGSFWGWVGLLALANLVFLGYDLALERLRVTLVPRLRRLFPHG